MTKQELHTLKKIIEMNENPYVPGVSYDENFQMKVAEELVPGKKNTDLLDSEEFKAGFKLCYQRMKQTLEFFMTASKDNLIKYAGKPKKGS